MALALKIKVLVVDDTVVYRKILKDVISEMDNAEVIAAAPNGELALKKIESEPPDLVLLDVEMPVMDGLETLQEIKRLYPQIGVIMVSGINERQANITMEALSKGAIDFVAKPIGNDINQNVISLKNSLAPIINLFVTRKTIAAARAPQYTSGITVEKTISRPTVPISKPEIKPIENKVTASSSLNFAPKPRKIDVLVIGVSTGGPNALAKFIPFLPADLGVPLLLVQHMPPMFTKSLANHLTSKSKLPVLEAEDQMPLIKNRVLIAPGGKHMVIKKENGGLIVSITDTPPVNSCKPSVDVLFNSIPEGFNGNILSVIMTGMGTDGMAGVKRLKQIGCYSLTQSEDTCVVYGMPRAVDEAGLSDESVPLERLAERVTLLIKTGVN